MDINGKLVVVTGSSKGIGLELVKQLLDKGAKVAGWSRSKTEIEHENFHFVKTDVSDADSVKNAIAETKERFSGKVSALVNNAGLGTYGPMDEMAFHDWKQMFDINVHGIFFCSNAVIPDMKDMDEGHIVNIGSIAGLNPVKNMVGYAGTKHAVTGISHSMYAELRDFGIKVTCIYPGSVKTNFFDQIEAYDAHDNMMRPEDVASSIMHCLETHENYFPVDLEIRPLRPQGKK